MSDWKSHRRCKMRHIAFSHDSSYKGILSDSVDGNEFKDAEMAMTQELSRLSHESCRGHKCCSHVENSASVLQHQGLLHISIWNVFQLSIDQDG